MRHLLDTKNLLRGDAIRILDVAEDMAGTQQREVKKGDRAQITLPGNTPVTGRVAGFGRVAQTPAGQGSHRH